MKNEAIKLSASHSGGAKKIFSKYGLYFAFIALIIILAIASPTFLTSQNMLNVLRQYTTIGVIAVGMTFVVISGGIDLSVGSVLALSACIATSYATTLAVFPLWVAILMGTLVGLACGAFNGLFIAKLRVAPFIATLATMTMARGLALVYTDGRPVINITQEYTNIGGGSVGVIPIPIIIFLVVILIGIFLLNFSKFGRYVFAIGGNEQAAKVSGISVTGVKFACYAITGVCAAIGGIVLSSRVMTGQPNAGSGYELDSIAAVVVGGSSLAGGVGSIIGTVVGVLIIGFLTNGLELLNVSSYYQQVVKGIIILVAVLLDRKRPA